MRQVIHVNDVLLSMVCVCSGGDGGGAVDVQMCIILKRPE